MSGLLSPSKTAKYAASRRQGETLGPLAHRGCVGCRFGCSQIRAQGARVETDGSSEEAGADSGNHLAIRNRSPFQILIGLESDGYEQN